MSSGEHGKRRALFVPLYRDPYCPGGLE
jgi:hypothetical protein